MKRKIKRFSSGGMDDYESSDDAKNLTAAAEREASEANEPKKTAPTPAAEPLKMASFGEAFREARNRGDKTFEYMGKKYTTEMAKPKAAPKAEAPKPKSFAQRQEDAASKMRSARADQISGIKKFFTPTADNPRIRRERASMQDIDSRMKKGGAVKSSASRRADGIAQRGKTRGKMV